MNLCPTTARAQALRQGPAALSPSLPSSRACRARMPRPPCAAAATSQSSAEFEDFVDYIKSTQHRILTTAEKMDGSGKTFQRDQWQRDPSDPNGGGRARVPRLLYTYIHIHVYIYIVYIYTYAYIHIRITSRARLR